MHTGEREIREHRIAASFEVAPAVDEQVDYNESGAIDERYCREKRRKTAGAAGFSPKHTGVLEPTATRNYEECQ